jgi:uncharacterized lipoprotein YddW (UPF0748 family)
MSPKSEIQFLSLTLLVSCSILYSGCWWFTDQKAKMIQIAQLKEANITQKQPVPLQKILTPKPIVMTSPKSSNKQLNPKPKKTPLASIPSPKSTPISTPVKIATSPKKSKPSSKSSPIPTPPSLAKSKSVSSAIIATANQSRPLTPWQKKEIRGIYLSRYQVTNNADEKTIRERVRYYHSQGINTIVHGVWGNACTMYDSQVMQQKFGFKRCPNEFNAQWLDWMIDEAHKQGMQVHAYFEKGIKIDKNSPIFQTAIANKWLVEGVDTTYHKVDHYILNVDVPDITNLFKNILVEFVQKYPTIDAVQWDDYLAYYAGLSGNVDRTESLTRFVRQMVSSMKKANPAVSFDICHHNPYWAKRYFAADWKQWKVDRVFIQAYNEKNFQEELIYAQKYDGIAITDNQLGRLTTIIKDPKIKNVMIFPLADQPEKTASKIQMITRKY